MTPAPYSLSPDEKIVRARRDLEKFLREPDLNPGQAEAVAEQLEFLPLPEVIDILERSAPVHAALVLRMLPRARAIAAFDALDAAHQGDMVGALSDDAVSDYFGAMEPDDRVSLLDELPAEIAQRLLHSLDERDKDTTSIVLGYEKNSMGRHMSPDVAMIRAGQTAGEALDSLRAQNDHVETIYTVPVVTADHRLVGVTSLRVLFTADEEAPVAGLMSEPISAATSAGDEETARWFIALDLLALPIVDDSGRLVGILSNDDAFDIVEAAEDEDVARSGASEPLKQPYLTTPLWRLVRSRVIWLAVLALSGLLTVRVLDAFEGALASAVVLSLFIPLLTGTGGNTGNQAATTITRALALGDVRKRDVLAVMWRETRVGLLLGMLLGSAFGLLLGLIYGPQIGLILGLTLLIVCTLAATVGGAMPIIAKAIGADPAVFSNPFITTFVDAAGLIIYFLIAKTVLGI